MVMPPSSHNSSPIRDLFEDQDPAPGVPFDLNNQATWEHRPRTPNELNSHFMVQVSAPQWASVFNAVPVYVKGVVAKGVTSGIEDGWYATAESDGSPADIYYYTEKYGGGRELQFLN